MYLKQVMCTQIAFFFELKKFKPLLLVFINPILIYNYLSLIWTSYFQMYNTQSPHLFCLNAVVSYFANYRKHGVANFAF